MKSSYTDLCCQYEGCHHRYIYTSRHVVEGKLFNNWLTSLEYEKYNTWENFKIGNPKSPELQRVPKTKK